MMMSSVNIGKIWLSQLVIVFLLILIVSVTWVTAKSEFTCEPVATSNCSCKLNNNGGTYNLQGLVDDTTIPRFQLSELSPSGGPNLTYFYDPCRVFSYQDCKDVAACALSTDIPAYTAIAVFDDLIYDFNDQDGKILTISYNMDHVKKGGSISLYKTSVTFVCDNLMENATLQLISGPPEYSFTLTSSFMCNQPFAPELPEGSLSFGTFLCITIPAVFLCYFSFGFMYLFFVKHESWRNAIPQHEFWFSLPGLIKEGASYTWSSITGKLGGSSTGYEQI